MNRKYIFLFQQPVYKDWAFITWCVLTGFAIAGGSEFIISAISMYFLSLFWLIPRRILFKNKSQSNLSTFVKDAPNSVPKVQTEKPAPATVKQNSKTIDPNIAVELRRGGYQEVVGESNYRKSFEQFAGRARTGEVNTKAVLIREPNNRFDKNAVSVQINGMTFGYIPRDEAPDWKPLLTHLEAQGKIALVDARVWWNFEGDSEYDPFGSVDLDVAEPELAIHVNEFPKSNSINIAGTRSYQLTGEQDYLPTIGKILNSALNNKNAIAWVTLALSEPDKTSKRTVEIAFENEVIGSLSSVTGTKFVPILESLANSGYKLVAECEVVGNALAAEAKLYVTLPEDFTAETVEHIKSLTGKVMSSDNPPPSSEEAI